MKELSLEQKTQRYDRALERAREWYNDPHITIGLKGNLEDIFPELVESEDEKIRKYLITYFSNIDDCASSIKGKDVVAWLEKQGEQKVSIDDFKAKDWYVSKVDGKIHNIHYSVDKVEPKFHEGDIMRTLEEVKEGITNGLPVVVSIDEEYYHCNNELISIKDQDEYEYPPMNRKQKSDDKVEPKFKVGDWIVWDNKIVCNIIKLINEDKKKTLMYDITDTNGMERTYSVNGFDNNARLWDVAKDAKEGDVLVNGDEIVIFRNNSFNKKDLSGSMFVYCSLRNKRGYWYTIGGINPSNYVPATTEQRDKLFETMKEAGYEWDADKKELKKIEDEEYNGEYYWIDSLWHAKNILEKTLGKVDGYQSDDGILEHKCAIAAVKKLYEQKPTEWSEEDENILNAIIYTIKNSGYKHCIGVSNEIMVDWLKSLKDRVQPQNITITDEELAQAKKDAYNDALYKIEYHSGEPTFDDGWSAAIWYLKKRNALPHSQWKPSDEQMADLYTMVCECRAADHQLLQDLYYGLKTLRGE